MSGMSETATERETAAHVYAAAYPRQRQAKAALAVSVRGIGTACILLGDLAAITAAAGLAVATRLYLLPALLPGLPRELPSGFVAHTAWIILAALAFFIYEKLYVRRQSFWRETWVVVKALTLTAIIAFAAVGLGKLSGEVSRSVIILWYIFALVLVPGVRYCLKPALARLGFWAESVLVLGAGKTGELVIKGIDRTPYMGLKVAAVLDDDPAKQASGIQVNGKHYRIPGGFADAFHVIRMLGIRNVIIAAPGMEARKLVELANRLQPLVQTVAVIPDLIGMAVATGELTYFFEEGIFAYRNRNNLAYPANRFIKRGLDIVLGSIAFVLALPLMVVIAVAIKLDSPGPVSFSHRRIGMGGKEFMCHKFRTMVVNAEEVLKKLLAEDPEARAEWERDFKLKNDPRVTRVGRLLRKTSLDELPQIFNVLKGEMSLVGPRPIVRKELDKFGAYVNDYLLVRPGITGLWQVSGRNDIDYDERIQLESRYIRNWSLWLDLSLILRTIPAVLKRDGAY